MSKRFVVVLFAAIVLIACQNASYPRVETSACPEMAEFEVLESPIPVLNPHRMYVAGGHLVIYQEGVQAPFSVISFPINDSSGFAQCGNRGNGPGEVVSPDIRSFVVSEKGFSFFDAGGIRKEFGIVGDTLLFVGENKFPSIEGPTNGMYPLQKGFLNVNISAPEYEFELYKKDGGKENKSLYPNWGGTTQETDLTKYLKQVAVRPDGQKALVLYAFFNKCRLLDGNGNLLKEITVNAEDGSFYHEMIHKEIFYSSYPCANDSHIVAKYGSKEIHVFDWNGNLARRIQLNQDFDAFAVDFLKNKLYAVSYSDDAHVFLLNSLF
jgi:hypothetical protein